MFELLLGVSGVGAKSALTMLSCIEPSDFAIAVISNNIKLLTQVPGIGAKSAQRIILELKDKKQCPSCNKEIEANVKFCPNCGAEQPKVEEPKKEEIKEEDIEIKD